MTKSELEDLQEEACQNDQLATSRYLCERILMEDPENGSILLRYADVLTSFSLFEQAKDVLDEAEELIGEDHQHLYFNQLGHLYNDWCQFDKAKEAYLAAHRLKPEDATSLIYAGTIAFQQGELNQAEEHARKATGCEEGVIEEAWFNLGGYLMAQQRFHEAEQAYKKALQLDADYEQAEEALEDLRQLATFQK